MNEPPVNDSSVGLTSFDVVIADDDAMVRGALGGLLDDHPSLFLVGSATNGLEAAQLCERFRPQLAVLDVMMPAGGTDAIAAVQAVSPATVIAFYTAKADRRTRERLIEAGASAVFAKGALIDLASELYSLVETAFRPEEKHHSRHQEDNR